MALFYNELMHQYDYEREAAQTQVLFLAGQTSEAAQCVPDELVDEISLVGTESRIKGRVRAGSRR